MARRQAEGASGGAPALGAVGEPADERVAEGVADPRHEQDVRHVERAHPDNIQQERRQEEADHGTADLRRRAADREREFLPQRQAVGRPDDRLAVQQRLIQGRSPLISG